jgi:phosphoribosylformylglycinamidine (FGAM) synthase-like amidotransferase family enzyme
MSEKQLTEQLKRSYTAWAMNRVEFLHYNCGISLNYIAQSVGVSYTKLKRFIQHGEGDYNLTDQELLELNNKLDTMFRY